MSFFTKIFGKITGEKKRDKQYSEKQRESDSSEQLKVQQEKMEKRVSKIERKQTQKRIAFLKRVEKRKIRNQMRWDTIKAQKRLI